MQFFAFLVALTNKHTYIDALNIIFIQSVCRFFKSEFSYVGSTVDSNYWEGWFSHIIFFLFKKRLNIDRYEQKKFVFTG